MLILNVNSGYFHVFYDQAAFEIELAQQEIKKVALEQQQAMWTAEPGTLHEQAVSTPPPPSVLSQQEVEHCAAKKDSSAPFLWMGDVPSAVGHPNVRPGFVNLMQMCICFYCGAELFDRDSAETQHIYRTLKGAARLQAIAAALKRTKPSLFCGKCGSVVPCLPAPFPPLNVSAEGGQ